MIEKFLNKRPPKFCEFPGHDIDAIPVSTSTSDLLLRTARIRLGLRQSREIHVGATLYSIEKREERGISIIAKTGTEDATETHYVFSKFTPRSPLELTKNISYPLPRDDTESTAVFAHRLMETLKQSKRDADDLRDLTQLPDITEGEVQRIIIDLRRGTKVARHHFSQSLTPSL